MSQEDVDAFKRGMDAFNRRDIDALLDELDPAVEWHPGMTASIAGESAAVYRGYEGVRRAVGELVEAFEDIHFELSEVRDLEGRLLAFGRISGHGTESGIEIDSPWAYLVQVRNAKAVWVRSYLDPADALEAAGLSE